MSITQLLRPHDRNRFQLERRTPWKGIFTIWHLDAIEVAAHFAI